MTDYLLDTDVAIELLRGRNVRVATIGFQEPRQIYLSTVTVAELQFGALRSREAEKSIAVCRQFCSSFRVTELDYAAAKQSGAIRADLEIRGQRIRAYDMLIAGIAAARGFVLVTHNVREFGSIRGLKVEDWVAVP